MSHNPIDVVKEHWKRMQGNDFAFAAEMFSNRIVIDWPQSNERILGKENFNVWLVNHVPYNCITSAKHR